MSSSHALLLDMLAGASMLAFWSTTANWACKHGAAVGVVGAVSGRRVRLLSTKTSSLRAFGLTGWARCVADASSGRPAGRTVQGHRTVQARQTYTSHFGLAKTAPLHCSSICACPHSADCISSVGMSLCSGAATSVATSASACRSASDCPDSTACSAAFSQACAATGTYCDPSTGNNVSVCLGTCQDRCTLLQPTLARANLGRCNSSADCAAAGAGLTCQSVAGRPCTWSACAGGRIKQQPCAGFCLPLPANGTEAPPGPVLLSAMLSGDGRSVLLSFSQGVSVSSPAPAASLDAATTAAAGAHSWLLPGSMLSELSLHLAWDATLEPEDEILVLPASAIASAITGVRAQSSSAVLQVRCGLAARCACRCSCCRAILLC